MGTTKMYKVVFPVIVMMESLVICQEDEDSGNGLAAGNVEILSRAYNPESFSCEGQAYGYYADVDSGCEVFHICLPIEDNKGEIIETAKYSFFCGNQTIFDQESLTCNHPDDAFPCDQSPSLFGDVEFGVVIPSDY